MSAALSPAASQAFTLIPPVVKLFVNPKAGYTTSLVQVRGTVTVNSTCTGAPLNFFFFFDSKGLWSKTVSACTASAWDTGWSPYQKPPVPPTVGKHVISLNVVNPANGATIGSASYAYSIYAAPASPQTQPTPSQVATPSQDCATGAVTSGCPSPTAKACPVGQLPAPGTGGWADNLIAGAMVLTVFPLAGLALVGPQTLLAAAYRRRRFLMLFGLSAIAALALNCTFPTSSTSPTAQVTPSASSTPSSCSA
jgi:hypothetical protein